jgi:hypothetical protein
MELAEGLIACWKQKSSGLKRAANEYCLGRADRQEMFSRESQRSVSLRLNALAGWPIRRNGFGIAMVGLILPVHSALKRRIHSPVEITLHHYRSDQAPPEQPGDALKRCRSADDLP